MAESPQGAAKVQEFHRQLFTNSAEPLPVGYADLVKEHIVEIGCPGDLLDRPNLDSRRFHVDEEEGQPLVLGHCRV